VYPKFFSWNNSTSQIVDAARERNLGMPGFAISEIKQKFPSLKDFKIGILGITYRPGVKEVALSGALKLLELLKVEGAFVYGDDPLLTSNEISDLGFDGNGLPSDLDGLILHTAHSSYQDHDFDNFKELNFFFDGRQSHSFLKHQNRFQYFSI
jgi:UDP-N-acetyl-D-mannosaminuronate dehydrogenase